MHRPGGLPYRGRVGVASEGLEAGQAALAAGDWPRAVAAFESVLDDDPTLPEALAGLGSALWWTNRVAEAAGLWERAYAGFRRRPDPVEAVLLAVNLSLTYGANFGNPAAASGWARRCERLAAELDAPPLRGWVLVTKSQVADDPAMAQSLIREAQQIALECGDRDLELCALAALGAALIDEGHVGEGAPLLDEAMAGSLGGEFESLDTMVFTSCVVVQACYRCADFARVVQWVHALRGFIDRYGNPYVNAVCRAHYGAVLVATGDWARAEAELGVAIDLAEGALPSVQAEASSYLADLRLARGSPEEALRLLAGFEDQAVVGPVLAEAHLAMGDAERAAATADRLLARAGDRHLLAARAREVLGVAHLALGEAEPAAAHADRLVDIGTERGCDLILARGERLLGRALTASGDPRGARAHLDAAITGFGGLEMPLEVARTRTLLAHALAASDEPAALDAARLALDTFEGLGATRDADAAAAWLRDRGVAGGRRGRPGAEVLTRREREVLALIGEGLSNPEIADRLYLSRRTVEHHVASILSKLGLRNRTEAAAHALREAGSVRG